MITAIAIISLVGYILGIIYDINNRENAEVPNLRPALAAVMVISWWNLCFPAAIVFLVIVALWTIIWVLCSLLD